MAESPKTHSGAATDCPPNVLSHPAFNRPAVANTCRRGRPGGTASLAAKRREKAAATEAAIAGDWQRNASPLEEALMLRGGLLVIATGLDKLIRMLESGRCAK